MSFDKESKSEKRGDMGEGWGITKHDHLYSDRHKGIQIVEQAMFIRWSGHETDAQTSKKEL